jgi:chromosome partitioning protein
MNKTMAKIIALAQHKGGVGKTTSTLNIGAALSKMGFKVLLVDLDAQANLTESLGLAGSSPTIADALDGEEIEPITAGDLDILPAALDLAGVEVQLLNQVGREFILRDVLEAFTKSYDYILIDCPPSLGILTVNALTAADEVYIPLQAQYLAVKGLNSLIEIIQKVKQKLNKKLKVGGVIITQYDARKVLNRDIGISIRDLFKTEVFDTKIRDNVALAEAPTSGTHIFAYAPTSYGAADYLELAKEILTRNKTKAKV